MFNYLTKTSVINLKQFTKILSTQFQRAQTSERDLVERMHIQ